MTALTVYNGPDRLSHSLRVISTIMAGLVADLRNGSYPKTAREMLAMEKRERSTGLYLADLSIAKRVIRAHMDSEVRRQASSESRRRYPEKGVMGPIKNKGWSDVTIILPGGLRLQMKTPYLRPSRKGLVGRPRSSGERGNAGTGTYPVLERLGIEVGASPLTRSMAAR